MQMNIKHILLTTDFSDAAHATYSHAQALAQMTGAKLTLLHVDEAPIADFGSTEAFVRYHQHLVDLRNQRLEEDLEKLSKGGLDISVETRTGDPGFAILEVAREKEVDLIMMARQSRRGLDRWLMGSTTRRVVRRTEVPVWVMPAGIKRNPPPVPPPYKKIITASDFSEDSDLGLQVTLDLVKKFDAELLIAHIIPPPVEVMLFPGDAPVLLPESLQEQIEETQMHKLKELVDRHGAQCKVTLETGSPPEAIARVAKREKACLIVLPSHGKGAIRANLFGSTTESVLEIATVPVIVLPRDWLRAQKPAAAPLMMPVMV